MISSLVSFLFGVLASVAGILILVNWKNLTLLLRVHYGRIYGQGFAKLITFPATIVFGVIVLVAAAYAFTVAVLDLP